MGWLSPAGPSSTPASAGLALGGGIGFLLGRMRADLRQPRRRAARRPPTRRSARSAIGPTRICCGRSAAAADNFGVATRLDFEVHPVDALYGDSALLDVGDGAVIRRLADVQAGAPDAFVAIAFVANRRSSGHRSGSTWCRSPTRTSTRGRYDQSSGTPVAPGRLPCADLSRGPGLRRDPARSDSGTTGSRRSCPISPRPSLARSSTWWWTSGATGSNSRDPPRADPRPGATLRLRPLGVPAARGPLARQRAGDLGGRSRRRRAWRSPGSARPHRRVTALGTTGTYLNYTSPDEPVDRATSTWPPDVLARLRVSSGVSTRTTCSGRT